MRKNANLAASEINSRPASKTSPRWISLWNLIGCLHESCSSISVWAKFRISYFTPLAGQLAACQDHFRLGFAITAHRVGSTWWPVPRACPDSTLNSPRGLDSMSAVAYLMEGPIVRMDHLWVIHSMSQSNPQVSLLYGTLSPTGPSHPTSWITSNGTGHTLRVELTHGLGHPTD